MAERSDVFGFSTHSLERGLERLMKYEAPYSEEQMELMRKFVLNTMEWNPFIERWVLPDYNAEVVVVDGSVVTIIIREKKEIERRPVTEFQSTMNKKCMRLGRTRNGKNKYK